MSILTEFLCKFPTKTGKWKIIHNKVMGSEMILKKNLQELSRQHVVAVLQGMRHVSVCSATRCGVSQAPMLMGVPQQGGRIVGIILHLLSKLSIQNIAPHMDKEISCCMI